ncbi:APC family permease [Streptococcus parauberis]|uniref:APC family permease n=1 Tax=Streptococcus parauberis TaxID=1348 RepID=UPI000E304516|nr:APC family permease [Streptococcus parauberis]
MTNKLSKIDVLALVVGSVIGWGAFYLPGQKFLHQSGVINTALGFLLGWIMIYFVQIAYHVMMLNHKDKGGEFSYVYNHLGKKHGFIVGWSLSFCYLTLIPLNASALTLVIKSLIPNFSYFYLYTIVGNKVYLSDLIVSTLIIYCFYQINKRGISLSMNFQKLLILLLVVIVLSLTSLILIKDYNSNIFISNYISHYHFDVSQILQILAVIPFLFVGFDIVPQVITDLGFNRHFATRMTVIATGFGVLIYNAINLLTALTFSPKAAHHLTWASGSAVLNHFGWLGFFMLAIALFAAIVGGINGFMVGSSRVIASLASYRLLPKYFEIENEVEVPVNALKFITFISILMPLLGRMIILYIVDLSSLMAGLTYAYVSFISISLSKTKLEKTFCYLGFIVGLTFMMLLISPGSPSQLRPMSFLILLLWVLLGYFYYTKLSKYHYSYFHKEKK